MIRAHSSQIWLLHLVSIFGLTNLSFSLFESSFSIDHASAQITPDNTLGSENSIVTPDVMVRDALVDRIDGGARRGDNLFHSFSEFNVEDLQRVYFANPNGINTIFSRVTGNDISEILGTLGVDGDANLFFLNPNGIVFGPNSTLDIAGSFVATTANAFEFANGSTFSAADPDAPPLLTVNLTPGLQYGTNAGDINNRGNLSAGRDLTLTAGNLTNNGTFDAERGNLRIEAIEGNINSSGGTYRARQDAILQAQNQVSLADSNVSADGELVIRGNESINIANSELFSERDITFRSPVRRLRNGNTFTTGGYFVTEDLNGNVVDFLIPHTQVIVAEGDVQFNQNYFGPSLHILAGGSVTNVAPLEDILVTNGDAKGTVTASIADGTGGTQEVTVTSSGRPTLDIRAGIDFDQLPDIVLERSDEAIASIVTTDNPTEISIQLNNVRTTILEGSIALETPQLPGSFISLRDGATVNTAISSGNNLGSGDVRITTHRLQLLNNVSINTVGDGGNSGDIDIIAHNLSLLNNADISATTLGQGNAGQIRINATGSIEVNGADSDINSQVDQDAVGNSGGIEITTHNLSVLNDADISATTFGQGDAGPIRIYASGDIEVNGTDSNINSQVAQDAIGNSGGITINAHNLSVLDGAAISAATGGQGNAGQLRIEVSGDIRVDGTDSDINSSVARDAVGNSEGIDITTRNLSILDNAEVSASTFGQGDAGQLRILASGNISVAGDDSFIASQVTSDAIGNSGGIAIITDNLSVRDDASVSASTFGEGNAGQLRIEASGDIVVDGSGSIISSRVNQDAEGNSAGIDITSNRLIISNGASVAASSEVDNSDSDFGTAGNVTINSPTINLGVGSEIAARSDAVVGGDIIFMNLSDLTVNGASVEASTRTGTAGNIDINSNGAAANRIQLLQGGRIAAEAEEVGGDSGRVQLNVRNLTVRDGGEITTSTQTGTAGSVLVNVREGDRPAEQILISEDSRIAAEATGGNPSSRAGNVELNARVVELEDNSRIVTRNVASDIPENQRDQFGNIQLDHVNELSLRNSLLISATGSGTAGNINVNGTGSSTLIEMSGVTGELNTGDLNRDGILDELDGIGIGGIIAAATLGQGTAGTVTLQSINTVRVNRGAEITVSSLQGQAGNVSVASRTNPADTIVVAGNGSRIAAEATEPGGNAGNVEIHTRNLTVRNGGAITAENISGDTPGSVQLTVRNLRVRNEGAITTSTQTGAAGSVQVNVREGDRPVERMLISDDSRIAAEATGDSQSSRAGNVEINARNVALEDNSRIVTRNVASDVAENQRDQFGNIQINNVSGLSLVNSLLISTTGNGTAGNIDINGTGDSASIEISGVTRELSTGDLNRDGVLNELDGIGIGGIIAAATLGQGNAGNVTLRDVHTVQVNRGAEITVSSTQGQAGNVSVGSRANPVDTIVVSGDGSRIAAEATGNSSPPSSSGIRQTAAINSVSQPSSLGIAGDILLNTRELIVEDGGTVTVSSESGQAGTLTVNSRMIRLDNGQLIAETAFTDPNEQGAEITLQGLILLLIENGSLISADARNDANGGNITIRTNGGFVIATPSNGNNDIIATAEEGNGGNIRIFATQIFGLSESAETRDQVVNNPTNDISASSEFGSSGTIFIDDVGVDPSRGLGELPVVLVDAPPLDPLCSATRDRRNQFINTGRGGIQADPTEVLTNVPYSVLWVTRSRTSVEASVDSNNTSQAIPIIINEAQGWSEAEGTGRITLRSNSLNANPQDSGLPIQGTCNQ